MAKNDGGNLTVLGFADMTGAENMLDNIQSWEDAGYLKVKDAVVVTRGAGTNTLNIKQTVKKAGKWSLGGGGIGFIAGLLLGGPIGGLVVGATIGAISGALKDFGIDDKQIKEISASIPPESSALFLLTEPEEGRDTDALMAELAPYKAKVVMTTLDDETADKLRSLLDSEG